MKNKLRKFLIGVIVLAATTFLGYTVSPQLVDNLLCSYAGSCEEAK